MGQLALRGLPAWRRVVIAVGPDALAALAGMPVGLIAGVAVGRLAAPGGTLLGQVPGDAWKYAAVALVGALLGSGLIAGAESGRPKPGCRAPRASARPSSLGRPGAATCGRSWRA
jgi:hypothetical protein